MSVCRNRQPRSKLSITRFLSLLATTIQLVAISKNNILLWQEATDALSLFVFGDKHRVFMTTAHELRNRPPGQCHTPSYRARQRPFCLPCRYVSIDTFAWPRSVLWPHLKRALYTRRARHMVFYFFTTLTSAHHTVFPLCLGGKKPEQQPRAGKAEETYCTRRLLAGAFAC